MLVNIANLSDGDIIDINSSTVLKNLDKYTSCDVPVEVSGNMALSGTDYILTADVKAVLNLTCDLCLEKFTKEISFNIKEIFSKLEDDNRDIWHIQDKIIDLTPVLVANVLLNFPMKALCREDCKGLCTKCGQNLNNGECGCDRFVPDPRMAIFKTLLNDKEV